jgi:hypothetical protein
VGEEMKGWEHDGDLPFILDYFLECCQGWEPKARLLGNARSEDIVRAVNRLRESRDFYKSRIDLLAVEQKNMRDPERTTVCNIIANGKAHP